MQTIQRSNKNLKTVWLLILVTIGMFGFGFALVPFYNVICNTLGINGKTSNTAFASDTQAVNIDSSRVITVEFIANHPSNLNWEFYPLTHRVKIHPGEFKQLSFFVRNKTNQRVTVQAIPSVTPGLAAKYLKKTECFCFTQQVLDGKESAELPLIFHLDPELPKNIHTLTLSYTLFDVSDRVVKPSNNEKRII